MKNDNTKIDDSNLEELSQRLKNRFFDPSYCFLCANHFDEVHLTDEHVIPKWTQKRFDLWNQQLMLLNRTTIPYRKLTVPCCEECNKYRLQPIEVNVSYAVSCGPEAVRGLSPNILFLWLGKIFYGILYREISLLLDRPSKNGLTIATQEMLRDYETHLLFLQQARNKIDLVNFTPGSIYIFKCQTPSEIRLQWDICDNIDTMFIGIRMGTVGLVGVLGDGGAQMIYKEAYDKLMDIQLHPVQFREICAHFSYRSSISTRTPKYIIIQNTPHKAYQMSLGGLSIKPYFKEWEDDVYGKFLAHYTGYPYEYVYQGPGKVMSWLHDQSGAIQFLDYNQYPFWPMNP